jgi:hypothetical protein
MANPAAIRAALVQAITRWDRQQSTRQGYNVYALGLYLIRLDEVMAEIEAGRAPVEAVTEGFNDRLRDRLLSAIPA